METVGLNFHDSFPPEREHIGRLLLLADNMPFMTKEEISAETGIPTGESSGKVIPHIRYAELMGLISVERGTGTFRLSKTPLGHEVLRVDPFLIESASQLLCHYRLTSKSGAALWHFIFREYLVTHGTNVSRTDVERSATIRFGVKANLSPFAGCYTQPTSFGSLNLLTVGTNREGWTFTPHRYDQTLGYVYAWSLLWEWDMVAFDTNELTLNDIEERFKWGAPFLWDRSTILEVLTRLQDLQAVRLNRQLQPVTVIRTMSTEAALQKMYSLLV